MDGSRPPPEASVLPLYLRGESSSPDTGFTRVNVAARRARVCGR
jgi:hypothetical protein